MSNLVRKFVFGVLFIVFNAFAFSAYAASPIGLWKTIDDVTGKPKGIVRIYGSTSDLSAAVVKIFPGGLTICSACSGRLKDKPIMGMVVMHGLKQSSDNPNVWSGGEIMDPKNGKVYSCTITVSADGRTLEVRGYLGISMFGRSQTWIREGR